MKHIIITWILGALIFCSSITAYAAENSISEIKPTIAILFPDYGENAKLPIQKFNRPKILGDIIAKFSPKYNIFLDDKKVEAMRATGMQDLTAAERGDIISFYKNDNVDFIIIIDMAPTQVVTYMTTSLQLKVIDLKNNNYFYNGKQSYTSRWAGMDGHYKELNKQIVAQLVKIFPME